MLSLHRVKTMEALDFTQSQSSPCMVWMEWLLKHKVCQQEATVAKSFSKLFIIMALVTYFSVAEPCNKRVTLATVAKLATSKVITKAKIYTLSIHSNNTKLIRILFSSSKNEKKSKISIATSKFSTISQMMRILDLGHVHSKWILTLIAKRKRLRILRVNYSSKPPICQREVMHQSVKRQIT